MTYAFSFQHQSLNVYQTPNVLCTSHVLVRSVETLVIWSSVEIAPSVESTTTEQSVSAVPAMKETRMRFAKNVSCMKFIKLFPSSTLTRVSLSWLQE